MKKYIFITLLCLSTIVTSQEINFSMDPDYINPMGENSTDIGFIPLTKLESDIVHYTNKSATIKRFPNSLNKEKTAYGYLYFAGAKNSVFGKIITLLVENYNSPTVTIHIDSNGNLDFTDDGKAVTLNQNTIINLTNTTSKNAVVNYKLGRSKIRKENEENIMRFYSKKFPKGKMLSATLWLTQQRMNIRYSKSTLGGKPITILLYDGSVDGLFTFETDDSGDRIFITDQEINKENSLLDYIRQGEPIDHNAVFTLHGKNYRIEKVSKNGTSISIKETKKETKIVFKKGTNVKGLKIQLLNSKKTLISSHLKSNNYLLIDVGGTWCKGCVTQEPIIKDLFNKGLANIIGIFYHDTESSLSKYIKRKDIKWPVALVNKEFNDKFKISSFPTYIIINPKGEIVYMDSSSEKIRAFLLKNK